MLLRESRLRRDSAAASLLVAEITSKNNFIFAFDLLTSNAILNNLTNFTGTMNQTSMRSSSTTNPQPQNPTTLTTLIDLTLFLLDTGPSPVSRFAIAHAGFYEAFPPNHP